MPELAAIVALVASAIVALGVSWRKWPDPIIDAGHQLYTAWRLAEGGVLYRDVGCLYGPLSSYFNALLFRIFGPGMMVLVWANLVIYTAIAMLAYRIFRAVYGAGGAFVALATFIWIFSFNQLVPVGNYTYALPYAHESTHGMLVTLALVLVANRWITRPGGRQALWMGLLGGLALVLKPEFILASLAVVLVAVLVRVRRKRPPSFGEVALSGLGACLPMSLFALGFWRHWPLGQAFAAANQAWWTVVVHRVKAEVWGRFLGTDTPWRNLAQLVAGAAIFVLCLGLMWLGARGFARKARFWGALVPVPVGFALLWVDWMQLGWCIPLALLAVLALRLAKLLRDPFAEEPLGLLLAFAALALLVRMFLHPRIYHFGFYQAALATMVVVAEIAALLRRATKEERALSLVVNASAGLVLVAACLAIFLRAEHAYSLRTFPVGAGRDAFFAFAPEQDAAGLLVDRLASNLAATPVEDKVLVVPEGLMINYLARRRSPLAEWIFIDLTLAGQGEATLVRKLTESPPAHVILISRDLREHGIVRFGAPGQLGSQMLAFFERNYELRARWGGDPLDPETRGAWLLHRMK